MIRSPVGVFALTLALLLAVVLLPSPTVAGEGDLHAEKIRSGYTKYEYRIPMRDGVRLFTSVYVPNDTSRSYPVLMLRTPYGVHPNGADKYRKRLGPYEEYVDEGFIFVYQDVRGRYMSEGEYDNMRPHRPNKHRADFDESTDT